MIKLKNQPLHLNLKATPMKFNSPVAKVMIVCLIVSFASCSDAKKQETRSNDQSTSAEYLFKLKLDTLQVPKLNKQAKEATEEWIHYTALNTEMQRLEEYTVQDAISNADAISRVVDSLVASIPKKFKTKAVKARVVALDTHSKLLLASSKRQQPDPEVLKELSTKLKIDFNNLILQLNEVYIINSQNEVSNSESKP